MAITETPEFSNFRSILEDLLSAINDNRANAEKAYEEVPQTDKVFLLLAAFSCEGMPPEIAELAAVLLRRLLSTEFESSFLKLNPDQQAEVKAQLIHHVKQDMDRNLRKKISDVAAELARNLVDDDGNNHWAEFLATLFDQACSPDQGSKEIALHMFACVPGIFGNQQSKYTEVIHRMLTDSLENRASLGVRHAAVRAISAFLLIHDKEIIVQRQFSGCLYLILQFFSQVMEDPESQVEEVLRHLVDLADNCPQSFRSQIDLLFEQCFRCLASTHCEDPVRHLALEVPVTLSESAPAMVRRLATKHIPDLIAAIFKMMMEVEDDPDWDFNEDSDDESDSTNVVAEAALDRLACALGGKTVLPIVVESLPGLLRSELWKSRYCGLMTISAVGEGCHKQMNQMLQTIVEGVLPFLVDSHTRVRYAACNALGQMASDFATGFQKKFGEKVIVGLLQLMEDTSSPKVQAHAGAALVNFFEDCPKQVIFPHLNSITDSIEKVLNSKMNELVQRGTKMVLEQVVVTLASLADCAEEKFLIYYDKFMPCLKYIIQNACEAELRLLRGKTIECISLIGLAVGKDKFLNDAGEVMDILLKSQVAGQMSDDDPQLTYMISAWARICKILGKGFEPYLPYVMEPVLKAAAIKPEIALLDADDVKVVENDDDWEFVNLGDKHNFGIRTSGLDEKSTACQISGLDEKMAAVNRILSYAKDVPEGFGSFVEKTIKLMVPIVKLYFPEELLIHADEETLVKVELVRAAAAEILPYLLEAAKSRGEDYLLEMWQFVLHPLLHSLESEPEPVVLWEVMGSLSKSIGVINSRCIKHEDLMHLIHLLNKKLLDHFEKAVARAAEREEEDYDDVLEEDLEREDDNDMFILGKISDIVSVLFTTYQQEFFFYFDILLPQFIQLLEPNRPWSDRQWALCVFSDVIKVGGPACSRYERYFLPPMLESLHNDEWPDLRQTAAYTIGCLSQYGGPTYYNICVESIPVLVNMINSPESRSEDNIKATENAVSALAKFLASNNPLINKDEVMSVWMNFLPIWHDEEECKYVYNFLCSALETNNPVLMGPDNCNLPAIVEIFAAAFFQGAIQSCCSVGKRVLTLVKDIQSNKELFEACVRNLNPDLLEALQDAFLSQ